MYFTLAISAATPAACAALVGAARSTDPRVMPVPGPVRVAWQAPNECAAMLYWGAAAPETDCGGTSCAGTIWLGVGASGSSPVLGARTGLARVDPVYVAETPGAVVVSDRASWAAAVTGRLDDHDPAVAGAFLCLRYPLGAATPYRRVRALGGGQELRVIEGRLGAARSVAAAGGGAGGAELVASALVEAVRSLAERVVPVELSLTGGKDSRLIAAALTAARVPFLARTHGFSGHPDVVIAGMIAGRLGLEHTVTEPRPATAAQAPDRADVLGRLRSAVLVSDGMLSAFENVGRPDPDGTVGPVQAGGHGGELLRGGYAQVAWRAPAPGHPGLGRPVMSSAAATELFRRLTMRRLGLLGPGAADAYLAQLAPFAGALAAGPLRALDDFYLANRAGRWSAAARQAFLIRSPLVQPFFDDRVIRAARAVPLRQRMNDRLHREVLALLCPALLDIPLADHPWKGEPRSSPGVLKAQASSGADADWRRAYGEKTASFLRDYILDLSGTGPAPDFVRRQAVERLLRSPRADPQAVWALATLTALLSGDWLNARQATSPGDGQLGPISPDSHRSGRR